MKFLLAVQYILQHIVVWLRKMNNGEASQVHGQLLHVTVLPWFVHLYVEVMQKLYQVDYLLNAKALVSGLISCTMVCPSVCGGNAKALSSGLSPKCKSFSKWIISCTMVCPSVLEVMQKLYQLDYLLNAKALVSGLSPVQEIIHSLKLLHYLMFRKCMR